MDLTTCISIKRVLKQTNETTTSLQSNAKSNMMTTVTHTNNFLVSKGSTTEQKTKEVLKPQAMFLTHLATLRQRPLNPRTI